MRCIQILTCFLFLHVFILNALAQDTFSIVAVDTATGEVGSAAASCVDLFNFTGFTDDFLGELFPGVGAINTQAAYLVNNQVGARDRMNDGYSPVEIIDWLTQNDAQFQPQNKQYGIVAFHGDSVATAAFTGTSTIDYANHITGAFYSIQGNILSGQAILDSMEVRFLREEGSLACRLMAAMQGANVIGADTRCAANGTSSLFAYVKVAEPGNAFNEPTILLSVRTPANAGIEPLDSLQKLFDQQEICGSEVTNTQNYALNDKISVFPNPAANTLFIKVNELAQKLFHVNVYDSAGKLIFTSSFNHETHLDTSGWKSGLYVLELSDEKHVQRKKVLIR